MYLIHTMLKCLYCLFARETANVSHLMFTNNNCTRLCLKGNDVFYVSLHPSKNKSNTWQSRKDTIAGHS